MVELSHLYYFLVAAEHGNFSKAARQLYISQPALSKSIAKLEEQLGTSLFNRVKGGIELSEAGRIYYTYVAEAFSAIEQGNQALEQYLSGSNSVALASSVSDLLHALIFDFLKTIGKELQIFQFLLGPEELEEKLLMGELDFVITPITIERNEVEQKKLMEEEVFLVVNERHPLADRLYCKLSDFKDDKFLVNESSFDKRIVTTLCEVAGFTPNIFLYTNEQNTIRKALLNNLGVSFVPANIIYRGGEEDMRGLRAQRVTDVECIRMISIAKQKKRILSPNAKGFYQYASMYFEQMGKELDAHFSKVYIQNEFAGRKKFGINQLKPPLTSTTK